MLFSKNVSILKKERENGRINILSAACAPCCQDAESTQKPFDRFYTHHIIFFKKEERLLSAHSGIYLHTSAF